LQGFFGFPAVKDGRQHEQHEIEPNRTAMAGANRPKSKVKSNENTHSYDDGISLPQFSGSFFKARIASGDNTGSDGGARGGALPDAAGYECCHQRKRLAWHILVSRE
jgi:hypothetical protein